uniref:NBS-LRR type resistance protein n=1 Tax=Cucumis melo TaxID=3656 RepID=A0A9I9EDD2_CUCME
MRIDTSSATIISSVHSRSNHGQTRLLDRSSLTIIVTGPSRFYNDSMSSLKEEGSRSIVWNCYEKHTFELGYSCRGPPRMRIIKCWNSNPSLPQRVVSHSLRMRYAIRCWVDDQATQKTLVGDPSRRPAERQVQAVRRYLNSNFGGFNGNLEILEEVFGNLDWIFFVLELHIFFLDGFVPIFDVQLHKCHVAPIVVLILVILHTLLQFLNAKHKELGSIDYKKEAVEILEA